ncbi:MAG: hypothetical protein PHF12_00555 [Candidatus Omnitrophica bacterium]|nr:hypothetical protein [Candidatus Omnitrophota bacterium]
MNLSGLDIFKKNYPNLFRVFKDVIEGGLSKAQQILFFDNLVRIYSTFRDKKDVLCLDTSYKEIRKSGILKIHHFFKFLYMHPPNSPFFPPCVDELEEALSNQRIVFEDKESTFSSLLGDRTKFWGTYCEFEIANNLDKVGCQVKFLKKTEPSVKYPDIKASINGYKFNIEVTSRHYELDKAGKFSALINKINDEAAQLPKGGMNVIIIFVSSGLLDSVEFEPEKIITPFDFADILYEDTEETEEIKRNGRLVRRPKRKLILYTREELRHVNALAIWFYGQVLVEDVGRRRRMISLFGKDDFPEEIVDLFRRIQNHDELT